MELFVEFLAQKGKTEIIPYRNVIPSWLKNSHIKAGKKLFHPILYPFQLLT